MILLMRYECLHAGTDRKMIRMAKMLGQGDCVPAAETMSTAPSSSTPLQRQVGGVGSPQAGVLSNMNSRLPSHVINAESATMGIQLEFPPSQLLPFSPFLLAIEHTFKSVLNLQDASVSARQC